MDTIKVSGIGYETGAIRLTEPISANESIVGTLYRYEAGTFELNLGTIPKGTRRLAVDLGDQGPSDARRPLAVLLDGTLDKIRIEIGEVFIKGTQAEIRMLADPPQNARLVF